MKFKHILIPTLLLLLIFNSCSTIKIINDNGKRVLIFSPRGDAYNKNKSKIASRVIPYEINYDKSITDSLMHKRRYQALSVEQLKSIANNNKVTVVLFWYTDCPTTTYQTLALANKLKALNIETILISLEYRFEHMDYNLYSAQHYYNSYLMSHDYGKYLITKQISFIKGLDAGYYNLYGNDVMEMNCLLLLNDGKIKKGFTRKQMDELNDDNLITIIQNL